VAPALQQTVMLSSRKAGWLLPVGFRTQPALGTS
jgi:hypothetical protein